MRELGRAHARVANSLDERACRRVAREPRERELGVPEDPDQ